MANVFEAFNKRVRDELASKKTSPAQASTLYSIAARNVDVVQPDGAVRRCVEFRAEDLVDFSVANHGSIVILCALTDAAEQWVSDHLPADVTTWGPNGYVVEPRYIGDILFGIENDGLVVQR